MTELQLLMEPPQLVMPDGNIMKAHEEPLMLTGAGGQENMFGTWQLLLS